MTDVVDSVDEVDELPKLPPRKANQLLQLLEHFPDEARWNWEELSCNPNVTIEWIEAHLEYPWSWAHVCENTKLDDELLV